MQEKENRLLESGFCDEFSCDKSFFISGYIHAGGIDASPITPPISAIGIR